MNLNYIEREQNKLADALAKEASAMNSFTEQKFLVVFKLEKLMENIISQR